MTNVLWKMGLISGFVREALWPRRACSQGQSPVTNSAGQTNEPVKLGPNASKICLLALGLANGTPEFYVVKGAGKGDHATNAYMKDLRQLVKSTLGSDYSEHLACEGTKYAFDFYVPEERTAVEVALSLHNPGSEYERDIFKCLLARDSGLALDTLLFVCKPGGTSRHEAPGSKRIRGLMKEKFGLRIEIVELIPDYDVSAALKRKAESSSRQPAPPSLG